MRRQKLGIIALVIASLSTATCAAYKPARVLTPEAYGMTCPTAHICLDDVERLAEAQRLRADAVHFIETTIRTFQKSPRVLFCATEDCFSQFGNPLISGQNVGTFGAVINAKGWSDHIVRHELIHHLQNERFGAINASFRLPRWFIEGMAYTMSEDPRRPLPRPEIEAYRARFEAWIAAGNTWETPPPR